MTPEGNAKIAEEIVDQIKFEITEMVRMGGHGGSNALATAHFYECVYRLTSEALDAKDSLLEEKNAELEITKKKWLGSVADNQAATTAIESQNVTITSLESSKKALEENLAGTKKYFYEGSDLEAKELNALQTQNAALQEEVKKLKSWELTPSNFNKMFELEAQNAALREALTILAGLPDKNGFEHLSELHDVIATQKFAKQALAAHAGEEKGIQ